MRSFVRLDPFILVEGVVEYGFGRGSKSLGYPTANLSTKSSLSLQKFLLDCRDGVYVGWVSLKGRDTPYMAAISVGINPTFEDSKIRLLEAYLIDYNGPDFYGETLRVLLCGHVRDSLKFTTLEALKDEISNDCQMTVKLLENEKDLFQARNHPSLRV
jgi:FAD synthase